MINLLPKGTVFYDLFEGLSRRVVDSAKQLQRLANEFPNIESAIQQIRAFEHEADDLAHEALDRLDRTFITPFDREDIHTLVGGMDDIVDAIDALAKRFTLYHVANMEPAFKKQAEILVATTLALSEAVHLLRTTRKLSALNEKLIEIHRLENVGDENNHAAISRLFEGDIDALTVMRWKEMYDRIEKAIDTCEDVSNTIARITLKNG
ncbi:MAG: DUF47 family protein [Phycisphaeraceae bacterium]|nr:DUF47 family protein [Phycisphaeraceae bacterium]